MMDEMTPRDRERYDAQAEHEAWSYALSVLRPWVDSARAIGSAELSEVMEQAEAYAQRELNRAQDKQSVDVHEITEEDWRREHDMID